MKKAALTIGLLSTVLVATSFAAPQTNSSNYTIVGSELAAADSDGSVSTGSNQGRKLDFHSNDNASRNNLNPSEGFRQDRQSLGATIKLD